MSGQLSQSGQFDRDPQRSLLMRFDFGGASMKKKVLLLILAALVAFAALTTPWLVSEARADCTKPQTPICGG
jgi:hypothetical protein